MVSRLPKNADNSQLSIWPRITQVVSHLSTRKHASTANYNISTTYKTATSRKSAWAEHPSRHPTALNDAGLLLAVLLTTSTAATETLFDLFGISQVELPGLDDSQLKKLYKRRALELHPDKSDHPDAEDRFRRLQEAYEGLKDPSTRSYFARFGQYDVWRNVKEYADEKLHHTRRGWVRTRRGVQMASERVDIRDEFVRGDGRVLPLHKLYDRAFGFDGVTVLLAADHDSPT